MSVATDRKLWVDGYNLSGDLNGLACEIDVDLQDDTVFGDTARSRAAGLESVTVQQEGIWAAGVGEPDTIIDAEKGLADVLTTFTPVDGSVAAIAYFMRTAQGLYTTGAKVGEILPFSVRLHASGGIGAIRGQLLVNANLAATGDGTAVQVGAVAAAESLYAGLHVLSAGGTSPTLDVTIESDNDSGFASPTTRITFTQATGISSQWATPVGGAITDDWWRASYTIGGTSSPNFDAVVVIGIR